jgi:5'-phosphate synthase pdxT subunit
VGDSVAGVFIRAPRIRDVGPAAEAMAWHGDEVVGVRQGRILGLCFHPELTQDRRLHRWFLTAVAGLELPPTTDAAPRPAVPRAAA